MRKKLLNKLKCPNFGTQDFRVFGVSVQRGKETLSGVDHDDLQEMDDIELGVVVDLKRSTAFPIGGFVLSMLSDEDVDLVHYRELIGAILPDCPAEYAKVIKASLERLASVKNTDEGTWNREEMEYYDADVATPELRQAFLEKIRTEPLWHIYLERGKHLVNRTNLDSNTSVLEVGCGNARSMAWLAPPEKTGYQYVGIDISWKRLLLAKLVMPAGDFVQASALALPFVDEAFNTTVAFSSIHHLPDPNEGIRESFRVLKDDGRFLLHEPIAKQSFLPEGKLGFIRRLLSIGAYEHSEHDNEIDMQDYRQIVSDGGFSIEHEYYNFSIMRGLLAIGPMRKVPFFKSQRWWEIIIWLDSKFISLVTGNKGRYGPGGVYIMTVKSAKNPV